MNRIIITLFLYLSALTAFPRELTIEECVEKATSNYPLIKKYNLIASTLDIDLSDINRGWLPRIGAYGQATVQNVVPSFPSALSSSMQQMGQAMRGLGKFQYKAGIDISQNIWDGGTAKARRETARTMEAVQTSALDVELYTVRQRVENLYFAILLTEEQISRTTVTYNLLTANLDRLSSMLKNGTAMQSDVDMIEAQTLELKQTMTEARSSLQSYKSALELFIGENLDGTTFVCPDDNEPMTADSNRPELNMFERRKAASIAAQRLTDTSVMPHIGFFAQTYYGYPGFNYFNSMINRNLSFNLLAGLKISWNIDSFYTKKNSAHKTAVNIDEIAVEREQFMFNSNIQAQSIRQNIKGLREVIIEDARIVSLRSNVRRAAESQLANGIIDMTALLSKISDENIAALNSSFHHIKLIQEIYNLKYTLNQ